MKDMDQIHVFYYRSFWFTQKLALHLNNLTFLCFNIPKTITDKASGRCWHEMTPKLLLLWTITATLLVETQTKPSFIRWLDRQYEVVRRGFTAGLIRTGSASKRGTTLGSQPNTATRSTSWNRTQQEGNNLRATSQRFNVSEFSFLVQLQRVIN
jgi:hypothetical protein